MRYRLILLFALFLVSACLPPNPDTPSASTATTPPTALPTAEPTAEPPTPTILNLQTLTAYRTTFVLRFQGTYEWTYELESSTDGGRTAYALHIEGVEPPQNPGDIRVVLEGDIARMRGPATEDACVQFPSDYDLGQSFLTPDGLIPPNELEAALRSLGSEVISGRETTHLAVEQAQLAGWRDVKVDVWKDDATGAVLRYDLRLTGSDPLFDAGEGLMSGQFLVGDVGPQTIEPIAGCEIDLPMPPDAARVVSMPGLIAFDSASTAAETIAFYQTALPPAGWKSTAEPETGTDAVLLSYSRQGQILDINIEILDAGVHVELLLGAE
jgi:hypothetical protein